MEVLGVGEDFVLVGILLLLYRALDDQRQYQYIDCQRCDGDHTLRYGVDQSRTNSGIHESVSVQDRDCGEDAPILEQGEYLGEHTPQSQGVGAVLNPTTLIPQGIGHSRSQQQCKTAEPGMSGQIQIGVLEVPNIISDDVKPDHIGPQHILLVLGYIDAPPAGHAEDVDDTGDAVEPVPPATPIMVTFIFLIII